MSALDQTQTCAVQNRLSALPPNATLNATYGNVRGVKRQFRFLMRPITVERGSLSVQFQDCRRPLRLRPRFCLWKYQSICTNAASVPCWIYQRDFGQPWYEK